MFCLPTGWGAIWSQSKFGKLDGCWEEKRACFSLWKARFCELFACTYLFRWCLFDFAKEIIFWRITRNLVFFVWLPWHLHQTYFTIDRFKDRDFNTLCASGGWLCSSPSTLSARCWWIKYKLQSSRASFGLCLASNFEFLFLHSCMIVLSTVSSPGFKLCHSLVVIVTTLYYQQDMFLIQ